MALLKQVFHPSITESFSASRLCSSILDFWSLLLKQGSWALKQTPGPLGPTGTGSPESSDVEWDEDIDMDFEGGNDDTTTEEINGDSAEDLVHDQAQSEPSSWNMARFLRRRQS